MPSTLLAYRLAEAYRRRTLAVRAEAVRAALVALGLGGDGFVPVAALAVGIAQRRASVLATVYLSDVLTVELGEPIPPQDVDPDAYADQPKLRAAFATVAAMAEVERRTAVERVAGTEPVRAGRRALRDAMAASGRVDGWRRMTGPQPCPLCRRLADGTVLPAAADLADHPGCACTAVPAVRGVPQRYVPPTTEQLPDPDRNGPG